MRAGQSGQPEVPGRGHAAGITATKKKTILLHLPISPLTTGESVSPSISPPYLSHTHTHSLLEEELSPPLAREGWSVSFIKSPYDSNNCPNLIQGLLKIHWCVTSDPSLPGDRLGRLVCQVNPDLCVTSDLSSSSEDSDTETCSEGETTPPENMETTPSRATPPPSKSTVL